MAPHVRISSRPLVTAVLRCTTAATPAATLCETRALPPVSESSMYGLCCCHQDMHTCAAGLRVFHGTNLLIEVKRWIERVHPKIWARRGGRDHIWLLNHDEGDHNMTDSWVCHAGTPHTQ